MARYFAFFYFMVEDPDRVQVAVPAHVDYWKRAPVAGYRGGPFADRTGGLITFAATDLAEASRLADHDPFATGGLLQSAWVKEWVVEAAGEPLAPPAAGQSVR